MGGRAHLDRSVGNVGGILFASQRDSTSWSFDPYDAEGALTVMPAVLTMMRRRCLPGLLVGAYVKQSGVILMKRMGRWLRLAFERAEKRCTRA